MKIISRVGEYLLPASLRAEIKPVLDFTGAGAALWTGTCKLVSWGWARLRERLDLRESLAAIAAGIGAAGYSAWHAPHVAAFAIPGTVIAWCVAAWCLAPPTAATRPERADDEPGAPDPQDVTDLVRDLIGRDRGILLTALRRPLHAPDTRAVRAVLAAADIPVRPGVRTAGGNGPGVHRDDLPAPSPPPTEPHVGGVCAGEAANTNANNGLRVESREGMTIISDPADRYRAHSLKKAP